MLNRRVVRSIVVKIVRLPGARLGLATLLGMLILFPNLAEAMPPEDAARVADPPHA